MEISFFKFLAYKWSELIFVVFIKIQLNNYVQDGCSLVLSIHFQETIIGIKEKANSHIPLGHCYCKLQERA